MNSRRVLLGLLAAAMALLWGGATATAEELILKNGQKIVGTIVGYENGMFRVETDFGIALVRKDKVASIQMSPAGSGDAASKRGEPKPQGATRAEEKAAESGVTPASTTASAAKTVAPPPPQEPAKEAPPPPPKRSPPPPPVSRPLDEPLPAHLQEHVEGSTYVSDTFQFAMFKPPGWKIYEGVPRETGSGIMAMGTEDEQTLLVVDRQVWSGVPDLKTNQIEAGLRQTYQDFQKLSEEPAQCGGLPAIRRSFTGLLDGTEWHGLAVHLARGNTVFGIIGLTSAETFQFQQAVLNKIINSFHFLTPASQPSAQPATNPTP